MMGFWESGYVVFSIRYVWPSGLDRIWWNGGYFIKFFVEL